jgi:hypothetical protein
LATCFSADRLKGGGAALAGLSVLRVAGPADAFPGGAGQGEGIPWADDQAGSAQALLDAAGQVVPWLDQPPPSPIPDVVGNLLTWEELDSWHTPADESFFVSHFGQPGGLTDPNWRVGIGGLVRNPQSLTIADISAGLGTRWTSPWSVRATLGQAWISSSAVSATPDGEARGWRRCWTRRASWRRAAKWSSGGPIAGR